MYRCVMTLYYYSITTRSHFGSMLRLGNFNADGGARSLRGSAGAPCSQALRFGFFGVSPGFSPLAGRVCGVWVSDVVVVNMDCRAVCRCFVAFAWCLEFWTCSAVLRLLLLRAGAVNSSENQSPPVLTCMPNCLLQTCRLLSGFCFNRLLRLGLVFSLAQCKEAEMEVFPFPRFRV